MAFFEKLAQAFKPNIQSKNESEFNSFGENETAFRFKEDAIKFVNDEYSKRQKDRRPIEMQWSLNMNFLLGNQYCDVDLVRNEIYQLPMRYDWEEREVFNQIASIYETRLSKLAKIKPEPLVRPASGETKDLAAAEISTLIAKGVDRKEFMQDKRSEVIAWMELCGTCFIKHIWNQSDGNKLGEYNGKTVYEGDINKVVVNPFELFPDNLYVSGIENQRSLIHAKAYPVEYISEKWGVEVKGETVDVFTLEQSNVGLGGFGLKAATHTYIQTQVENQSIVKEYISLPSKQFPKGIIIVVAGDQLLDYKEMAFNIEDKGRPGLPYEMYVVSKMPGHFYPPSIIERIIPIQRTYNAVKNRKHEALNRKAIGVLAIEDDGNLDTEDLEESGLRPGAILPYGRGTQPPRFLQDGGSTVDFDNEEIRLERMFERISGVSAFSSASVTPAGESGAAMEQRKEQDDSRIGLTAENINNATVRSARIDLRLYKQFAKGPRLLQFVGENNDVLLQYWNASDLSVDDVIIEKEDSLNQTVAQRRQMVIQLIQYGLFKTGVDPRERQNILKALEIGDWENLDSTEDLHKNKSLRENQMLTQRGAMPPADDFDDHNIHITEHNRFRLSVDYEKLKYTDMQSVQMLAAHIAMHEQFLAMRAQQAMAMQAMATSQNAVTQ